jgi:uncharacterized membrane protein YeiB
MTLRAHPAGRHRGARDPHPLTGSRAEPAGRPGGTHASTHASTHRPVRHRAEGRLAGLDLARGLAVVSMLVAHLQPVDGVLRAADYVTAPLFAVVIGASMAVRLERRRPPASTFVLDNVLRGLLLVALGVLLQHLYGQIDVVLPYLGLLVIVLAPLAVLLHRLPVLTVGLAVAGAVLGPLVVERVRDAQAAAGAASGDGVATLVQWVAAGPSYRLVSLLPMALGGLALAAVLPRAGRAPRGFAVAGVLVWVAVAVYALGTHSAAGAAPYSGSTAEVVGATLLASGVVVVAFGLVDVAGGSAGRMLLAPFLATGRLALTAYTLQVLLLALLSLATGGAPDDGWAQLASLLVLVLGACWVLDRWWGTGPLEWLVGWAHVPERREVEAEPPAPQPTF